MLARGLSNDDRCQRVIELGSLKMHREGPASNTEPHKLNSALLDNELCIKTCAVGQAGEEQKAWGQRDQTSAAALAADALAAAELTCDTCSEAKSRVANLDGQ